ncbi:MAG: Hsp20/alpha crystallin family protein [Deltaproteobacteria bacterium]|nr:Hsp20/alpha crystallin family protein [Deltaproteobacteria bacterium]
MKEWEGRSVLNELKSMKDRMERLFSEVFEEAGTQGLKAPPGEPSWEPTTDLWETKEEWVFSMDLPGVDEQEVSVEIAENRLIIRGKRETVPSNEGTRISFSERPRGVFERSFAIPPNVMREGIEAKFGGGVLTVTVPKEQTEEAAAIKVKIRTA